MGKKGVSEELMAKERMNPFWIQVSFTVKTIISCEFPEYTFWLSSISIQVEDSVTY